MSLIFKQVKSWIKKKELIISIRKEYPYWTEEELNQFDVDVLHKMYIECLDSTDDNYDYDYHDNVYDDSEEYDYNWRKN